MSNIKERPRPRRRSRAMSHCPRRPPEKYESRELFTEELAWR
jgi:hypothetical protein